MKCQGRTEKMSRPSPTVERWHLRVLAGPDRGVALPVEDEALTVGSEAACDLILTDPTVSGRHLLVSARENGMHVEDLGSTNGVFYLETKISRALLPPGAVLTLGRTRLALMAGPIEPATEDEPGRAGYGSLVGSSPAMQQLYATLVRLESSTFTVLIVGETGTGKELVAREIHANSERRQRAFEILDCGAVPANLAASELFGHVRGAFTGAERDHAGVFERAAGGTVFLDEIGELASDLQPALLRVLENGQVRPLGGKSYRDVDVRVIAATNRSLDAEVKAGRFRRDLYFRLNVVEVTVPALRDRLEDIPALATHILNQIGFPEVELSAETIELLTTGYDWPGNVRELRNAMARLASLGTLPSALAEEHARGVPSQRSTAVEEDVPFLDLRRRIIDTFERDYLSTQMRRADGNISQAARSSGMDRAYFRRLLVKHALVD